MGGGLMQLVAYGAQDVYLTGNPQITFFKVVYRRHTNFAVEPIQQVWNGSAEFGRTVTATLNRNGDLITNMYSVVQLSGGSGAGLGAQSSPVDASATDLAWAYVRRLGYAMIAETKVEIGGSKIDEQYGDWLNIWYELSHKVGQERGHKAMVGDSAAFNEFSVYKEGAYLYIPLAYWFNRFNGLALPLIALQYHDVRVTIQYAALANCINWNCNGINAPAAADLGISMVDNYLLIDYVYLDSEERKRFAQASHEYLIEQLQFTGSESLTSVNSKYRLNFNHPSKYLIWVAHLDPYVNANDWLAYSGSGDWSAALERAAKLIFIQSRNTLKSSTSTGGGLVFTVDVDLSNNSAVDVSSSYYWYYLLPKVEGQFLYTSAEYGNGFDSDVDVYPATLDNVVITRNELNSTDISVSLATLIDDLTQYVTFADTTALDFLTQDATDNHTVNVQDAFNYGLWLDGTVNPVGSAKLQLNGHDRFQERDGNYFNYVQPYQHFSNTPSDGINVYSFALKPEDHQPSGTCNFSRIDNATLNVALVGNASVPVYGAVYGETNFSPLSDIFAGSNDSTMNIYTVNYNVLRVMSGMAGTAYSN